MIGQLKKELPMSVAMKEVQSSQLASMGYNETTAQLFVRFNPNKSQAAAGQPGSLYRYEAVPMDVWNELNAEGISIGSTFIRLVKSSGYQYSKLD